MSGKRIADAIRSAVNQYRIEHGSWPKSFDDVRAASLPPRTNVYIHVESDDSVTIKWTILNRGKGVFTICADDDEEKT